MKARWAHTPAYRQLCAQLREWRLAARLSQSEAARRMGTSQSVVAKIESGDRRIDPFDLLDWAAATGVDPVEAVRVIRRIHRMQS